MKTRSSTPSPPPNPVTGLKVAPPTRDLPQDVATSVLAAPKVPHRVMLVTAIVPDVVLAVVTPVAVNPVVTVSQWDGIVIADRAVSATANHKIVDRAIVDPMDVDPINAVPKVRGAVTSVDPVTETAAMQDQGVEAPDREMEHAMANGAVGPTVRIWNVVVPAMMIAVTTVVAAMMIDAAPVVRDSEIVMTATVARAVASLDSNEVPAEVASGSQAGKAGGVDDSVFAVPCIVDPGSRPMAGAVASEASHSKVRVVAASWPAEAPSRNAIFTDLVSETTAHAAASSLIMTHICDEVPNSIDAAKNRIDAMAMRCVVATEAPADRKAAQMGAVASLTKPAIDDQTNAAHPWTVAPKGVVLAVRDQNGVVLTAGVQMLVVQKTVVPTLGGLKVAVLRIGVPADAARNHVGPRVGGLVAEVPMRVVRSSVVGNNLVACWSRVMPIATAS